MEESLSKISLQPELATCDMDNNEAHEQSIEVECKKIKYKVYMMMPVSKTRFCRLDDLMEIYERNIMNHHDDQDQQEEQEFVNPGDRIDIVFTIGLVSTGNMIAPHTQWIESIKEEAKSMDIHVRFELLLSQMVRHLAYLSMERSEIIQKQYRRVRYFDTIVLKNIEYRQAELIPDISRFLEKQRKRHHDTILIDAHLIMAQPGQSIIVDLSSDQVELVNDHHGGDQPAKDQNLNHPSTMTEQDST